MATVTQADTATESLKDDRLVWLARNRGALSRLRQEFGLHATTIRRIYWGEITSGGKRVEKRLAEMGAPGFDQVAAA